MFSMKKHKKDNWVEFLDFNELTLYMIFAIFMKMAVPIMARFIKNFKYSYLGSIRKI